MFENDGLWPCKCRQCKKEWYASIAAIRADEVILCPYCDVRDSFRLPDFNQALAAARSGDYDFSYLERISPQFRSGAHATEQATAWRGA
jgi:hypothetical protein